MTLRRVIEPTSIALIGLGLAMLMQPWSLWLFGHSFAVLLAGVAGYTVAGKLAECTPRAGLRPARPPRGIKELGSGPSLLGHRSEHG